MSCLLEEKKEREKKHAHVTQIWQKRMGMGRLSNSMGSYLNGKEEISIKLLFLLR